MTYSFQGAIVLNANMKLLDFLPAVYQDSVDLLKILTVFENVLFRPVGQGQTLDKDIISPKTPSVEDHIARIPSLFDAYDTPGEFLPWLAQWVALFDLDGLEERRQRQLIAEIVPLYSKRGTKYYLEKLLNFFLPENATASIEDQNISGFIIETSKIGVNSWLGRDIAHWFVVTIQSPEIDESNPDAYKSRWEKQIRRVINLAKPAHTLYKIYWKTSPDNDEFNKFHERGKI